MQKYYLLTFNEDWADEHNVPALTCFTEKEYQKWLEQPTGNKNKNYEKQKTEFDEAVKVQNKYEKMIRAELRVKGTYTYEQLEAARVPYVNSYHDEPKKFFSAISARLGNNGDGFGENFEDYEFCKDLVEANIVGVHEVNKEFFNVFKEVDLSSLSLCNVFNESLAENVYEEDEE